MVHRAVRRAAQRPLGESRRGTAVAAIRRVRSPVRIASGVDLSEIPAFDCAGIPIKMTLPRHLTQAAPAYPTRSAG